MNRTVFIVAASALLLSACGAPATPTIDAAQVQASAVAAASTMVAATQAAMPTNTPVPPTPVPSPTPLPGPTQGTAPTLAILASPTTASSSSSGKQDCNHLLDVGAAGASTTLLIRNNTKGAVTFSMGLGSPNSYGQCGYLGWSIPKANSISVTVAQNRTNQGDPCYWVYAFVNDPKHQTTVSDGGYCLNNPDKWTIDIGYDKMKLTPP